MTRRWLYADIIEPDVPTKRIGTVKLSESAENNLNFVKHGHTFLVTWWPSIGTPSFDTEVPMTVQVLKIECRVVHIYNKQGFTRWELTIPKREHVELIEKLRNKSGGWYA